MKTKFLLIALLIFSSEILIAQNIIRDKINSSVEFRETAEKLNLEPGSFHTVNTTFIIDNTGLLENITAESEYPELEPIAINILKSIPKEQAPKHKSSSKQLIKLPMKFYVETEEQKRYRLRKESRKKKG